MTSLKSQAAGALRMFMRELFVIVTHRSDEPGDVVLVLPLLRGHGRRRTRSFRQRGRREPAHRPSLDDEQLWHRWKQAEPRAVQHCLALQIHVHAVHHL